MLHDHGVRNRGCGWLARLLMIAAPACAAGGSARPEPVATPGAKPGATLVNASVRAAYVAGVYDGFVPVAALRAQGDFGLGAADANDGELVALDGAYYRARGDGSVVALRDDELVPFASVTRFRPDRTLHLAGPLARVELEARLDAWLGEPNRLFALRIHGRLARVVAGASAAQTKPYRPFPQVWAEYNLIERHDVVGSLVGFRTPAVFRDIARQGYHFHLLSDDRRAGGHVDDETVVDVDVEAQELHDVQIVLSPLPAFLAAELPLLPGPAKAGAAAAPIGSPAAPPAR